MWQFSVLGTNLGRVHLYEKNEWSFKSTLMLIVKYPQCTADGLLNLWTLNNHMVGGFLLSHKMNQKLLCAELLGKLKLTNLLLTKVWVWRWRNTPSKKLRKVCIQSLPTPPTIYAPTIFAVGCKYLSAVSLSTNNGEWRRKRAECGQAWEKERRDGWNRDKNKRRLANFKRKYVRNF